MLLSYSDIQSKGLIVDSIDKKFTDASYGLTIGKIITLDDNPSLFFWRKFASLLNKGVDPQNTYRLKQRGMVVVVSKETIKLPNNIMCYTTVKNSLSIKGIMAVNIGIIDPLWNSPVSTILINFGKKAVDISLNESAMRVSFHEFSLPENKSKYCKPIEFTHDEYVKLRETEAKANLDETFLYMDGIKKQIVKDMFILAGKWIASILVIITFIGFSLNVYNTFKNNNKPIINESTIQQKNKLTIDSLRYMILKTNENNQNLNKRIDSLSNFPNKKPTN